MGGGQSSAQSGPLAGQRAGDGTLKLAIANLRRAQAVGGGGGCGCCDCECECVCGGAGFFGGNDSADASKELREYEASFSAKAKEDLIRRLARGMKRAGISVDPDGDLDDIVKQLVAQIPNARNGKTFSTQAAAQEKVCRTVADVLNDEYSPGVTQPSKKFIDTSLSPVEICRSISEWAHSFASGVNTEFLAVHTSVRNALQKIVILDQVMAEAYAKITDGARAHGDEALARVVGPLDQMYTRAQHERRMQEELLKNILHVNLAPAAKELELAMRDESEQNALIKKIGLKPGTSEFADSLAMSISSLGTAAAVAARVHAALKRVGASVRQYLDSPDYADFQRALDAKIEGRAVKPEDLANFLEAVDTLRMSFGERKEPRLRSALEEMAESKHGGADDEKKSAVTKKVERHALEEKIIIRDFASRMARHYDELLAAVKAIGPHLGRDIPLTDKTDALNEALKRLRDMRDASERIELALIGMYVDASARERKERFAAALRQVSAACTNIMELEMYRASGHYFAQLKTAIDAIEKTVDYFSDAVAKKYGGNPPALDDGKHGGGPADYLPEIARSGLSFGESVNEFAYYYYVSKVHANLQQTATELEAYGEKYVDLLGDAVAGRLYTLEAERKAVLAVLAPLAPVTPAAGAPLRAAPLGADPFFDTPVGKANYDAVKKWIADEYDVKAKLYRALQAMDLYMKAFTLAIAKNPDAVRDIKKMLDGTQVIARWYSAQTGDSICKAFDQMSAFNFAGGVKVPAPAIGDAAGDHYYDKVRAVAADGKVGIPELGVNPGDAHVAAAKKSVGDAWEHLQVLKNLVNAFARIGDKFGDKELRTQIFMSPTQIYKTLIDYLKQSAMSVNKTAANLATPAVQLNTGADVIPAMAAAVGPWQVYFGAVDEGGATGNYAIEDRYFALIVKAMGAKVLTALGVYDMFERTSPLYELTPTRMIVGGAFDGEPEVIEGAAELYFRLIRLAEFYREPLQWDGKTGDEWKVAMLPELEGVFSGLIRIIFQKAVSPDTGDYSDSEMQSLVREVNRIYEHFRGKSAENVSQTAIAAFISEINRRYGVIKKKDMADYWAMVKMARTGKDYGTFNDTNYAILPGEGDDPVDIDRRAPSDRYPGMDGAEPSQAKPFASRVDLDTEGKLRRQWLREFRMKFDKQFELADHSRFGRTSFALLIKQAEMEIHRATSPSAKFLIATKLIQGTSIVGTDANKAFMFHETVMVGLNVLSSFEALLRSFDTRISAMNPREIENAIMDAIYLNAAGGAAAPVDRAALIGLINARRAGMGDRYAAYIVLEDAEGYAARGNLAADVRHADVHAYLRAAAGTIAANQLAPDTTPSTLSEENFAAAAGPVQAYVRALRLGARLLVDYGAIMRNYVENLFALTGGSQGLIDVRIGTGIQLGFAKFRELIERTLSEVKYFFELFRPYMTQSTIDRFEKREIGGAPNAGSIFWIEEKLVDKYFHADDNQEQTLEAMGRRTMNAFADLIRDTGVSLVVPGAPPRPITRADFAANFAAGAPMPNDMYRYEQYGQVFSGLVFYDAVDNNSGLVVYGAANAAPLPVATGATGAGYGLAALIKAARDAPGAPQAPAAAQRFGIYTNGEAMTQHRSLMFAYNQLVARYLATLSDTSGMPKIYLNLVNSYANGVVSASVSDPLAHSFPDLIDAAGPFGFRGDPKPSAVLCQSLAFALQRIIKDVDPRTQLADHVTTTLIDTPLYMKEALRANLPVFIKLFDTLAQKGDFIKQVMQKTGIKLGRPAQQPIAGAAPNTTIWDGVAGAAGVGYLSLQGLEALTADSTGDAQMKSRITSIIDSIFGGATTLSNAASETLRELADAPVYLQTQEGFIEQYKMRYGKLPLMPLSLSFWYLNNLERVPGSRAVVDSRLYPNKILGTPAFKMLYGCRQLLATTAPVGFDQLPSVKASLDAYNGVSSSRERIDDARYLKFVQMTANSLRYLVGGRNFIAALSQSELFNTAPLLVTPGDAFSQNNGIVPYDDRGARVVGTAVYALSLASPPDPLAVLSVVESSNQDEEARRVSARASGGDESVGAGSRKTERLLNIIDMNVMPFNFHAFMRDVPLANLYNFEYTLEQMVVAMYGEQSARYMGNPPEINDANTTTTRQMLLRLLIDPYMAVPTALYGSSTQRLGSSGFVQRIFRGDNNLGMGRPKFLSDQLFNKSLFGSIYESKDAYDEGGPAVGIGATRGLDAATSPSRPALIAMSAIAADIAALNTELITAFAGGVPATQAADDIVVAAIARIEGWGVSAQNVANNSPNAAINAAVNRVVVALTTPGAGVRRLRPLTAAFLGMGDSAARILNPNFAVAVGRIMAQLVLAPPANPATVRNLIVTAVNEIDQNIGAESQQAIHAPGGAWNAAYAQAVGSRRAVLTYLRHPTDAKAPDSAIVEVPIGFEVKRQLEAIGKMRFDTRFIRNIFLVSNMLRILRLKLNRELTQSRSVLVSSHMAVTPGVTEYGSDPFGPDEVMNVDGAWAPLTTDMSHFNDNDHFA